MDNKKVVKARHVLPKLREMQVGSIISFPLEWIDTVRTQSSKCNLLYGGVRRTSVDADKRLINVERVQ